MPAEALVAAKKAFGRRLREERQRHRLTQAQLSELAGLSSSYVANIERGEENPAFSTLFALCAALQVDLAQLFSKVASPRAGYPSDVLRLNHVLKDVPREARDAVFHAAKVIVGRYSVRRARGLDRGS